MREGGTYTLEELAAVLGEPAAYSLGSFSRVWLASDPVKALVGGNLSFSCGCETAPRYDGGHCLTFQCQEHFGYRKGSPVISADGVGDSAYWDLSHEAADLLLTMIDEQDSLWLADPAIDLASLSFLVDGNRLAPVIERAPHAVTELVRAGLIEQAGSTLRLLAFNRRDKFRRWY